MKLYDRFKKSAGTSPDNKAIVSGISHASYQSLTEYIDRLASIIQNRKQQAYPIVATFLNPSIEYVASILAINSMDGTFMPLDPTTPVVRAETMLRSAEPDLILCTNEFSLLCSDRCAALGLRDRMVLIPDFSDDPHLEHFNEKINLGEQHVSPVTTPSDAYLFYTSGSTGSPKAIRGSEAGVEHFIDWETKKLGLSDAVVVGLFAPLSFDVSLRDIFVPLFNGGTLCIPPPSLTRHPVAFLDWVCANRLSLVHMVPSLFRLLTTELQADPNRSNALQSLRYILLAGEPLYSADVRNWQKLGLSTRLINLYGPSETTLAKVFFDVPSNADSLDPVVPLGHPLPGAKIHLYSDGKPVRAGEIGEIAIQTKFLSFGYFKDTELTGEKFKVTDADLDFGNLIYMSGDLGRIGPDGELHFIGRLDQQVKVNGNRVELIEVESNLSSYSDIQRVAVSHFINGNMEIEIAAYYVAKSTIAVEDFQRHLSDRLPKYMHPNHYVKLEKLPMSINGKIDRKALPKPAVQISASDFEPCISETERRIESIWKDLLKVEKVGRNVSFFVLGGSSLKAIQILSRLQKEFHVLVKLTVFFARPYIKDLAQVVESAAVPSES